MAHSRWNTDLDLDIVCGGITLHLVEHAVGMQHALPEARGLLGQEPLVHLEQTPHAPSFAVTAPHSTLPSPQHASAQSHGSFDSLMSALPALLKPFGGMGGGSPRAGGGQQSQASQSSGGGSQQKAQGAEKSSEGKGEEKGEEKAEAQEQSQEAEGDTSQMQEFDQGAFGQTGFEGGGGGFDGGGSDF